jgi:hypothetical protein
MTTYKRRLRRLFDAEEARIKAGVAATRQSEMDRARLPARKAIRQDVPGPSEEPAQKQKEPNG